MKNQIFDISIRCQYPNGDQTKHRQPLKLSEIPKWVDAYKFTHPACKAITFKIWFDDQADDTIE